MQNVYIIPVRESVDVVVYVRARMYILGTRVYIYVKAVSIATVRTMYRPAAGKYHTSFFSMPFNQSKAINERRNRMRSKLNYRTYLCLPRLGSRHHYS